MIVQLIKWPFDRMEGAHCAKRKLERDFNPYHWYYGDSKFKDCKLKCRAVGRGKWGARLVGIIYRED